MDGYGLRCWWRIDFGLGFYFCGWVRGLIGVVLLVVDGYGLRCWWRIDFGLGFTVMEGRWVSGFWLMVDMVCGGGGNTMAMVD